MAKKKYSKETIVGILKAIAANTGTSILAKKDISKYLSPSVINYYFGSLGKACTEAGLGCAEKGSGIKEIAKQLSISDDELFQSIHNLEQQLGHTPGHNEYAALGQYSPRPFRSRFSSWSNTIAFYNKWKDENSTCGHNQTIQHEHHQHTDSILCNGANVTRFSKQKPKIQPLQFYGEPLDFRGLRHAPINEQGVVYLFGMVSRELGFSIESIQQGFPDCEGKYLFDDRKGLWAKARIEFEYKASNFKEHGHDQSGCDFIVCWINDWDDCPIQVIELKHEIMKLSSR